MMDRKQRGKPGEPGERGASGAGGPGGQGGAGGSPSGRGGEGGRGGAGADAPRGWVSAMSEPSWTIFDRLALFITFWLVSVCIAAKFL